MWCYQKPGFEALLVSNLQRQQQCSQFCDTVLKTGGVSVPAHSCILSAISPIMSSALSSTPPPPPGQSHLLEFRSLGTCTLLHLVRLLYSGEMVGEGEEEKREAVSAAAKLGIHGLVEVTRRDRQADVGVQTEPVAAEDEGKCGRWRREVRDGNTFLVQEALSAEVQVNAAAPSHPAASFETIDMASLQTLGLTDPHLPPSHPYVPISVVYPLEENQTHQHPTAPADFMQESASTGHGSVGAVAVAHAAAPPALLPFSSQETLCAVDPHSWCATADEEWEDDQSEQFQGNIPGYINYFLNPDKKEASHRGQPRGRRRAREGGARRARTGERGARRPRGRPRGSRLTQTVDVQEVGMSRLQKLFMQRWGSRPSRTGQGGGAAGRRLYLKTRELLKPGCQRRRGRSKMWDFNPSKNFPPQSERGAGGGLRGRRSTTQQPKKESFCAVRSPRGRAKPAASLPFSSLPARFYNGQTLPASSPSLQQSSSSDMLSPAASYMSQALPLPHTASVPPPPAPPPNEDQPEHFDRLLEEVMMGLDILSNNSSASQFQVRAPTNRGSCASSGDTSVQNKQQSRTNGLLEAGHASSPVLQQQGEGELSEMLEHFLQSFEQQVAREEVEMGRKNDAGGPARSVQTEPRRNDEAGKTARRSRTRKASPRRSAGPKPVEGTPVKRRKRRGKNVYRFTSERKSTKRPASSGDAKSKTVIDRRDKQLQQRPVVQLERSGPLPVTVNVQGHSCQSLEVKSQARTKTDSSVRNQQNNKNRPVSWSTKTYPIRSRLKEAQIDSSLFHEKQFVCAPPPSAGLSGRKRSRVTASGQPASLPNGHLGSTLPATQPRPPPPPTNVEQEMNRKRLEKEDGDTQRGKKRGAESEGEASDDATVAKRVCLEQTAQTASECADLVPEPTTRETDDIIDVETVSLTGLGDFLQSQEAEEKPVLSELKLRENTYCVMDDEMESSSDEIIDVDGDTDEDGQKYDGKDPRSRTGTAPFAETKPSPAQSEVSPGSTGSRDRVEEIDVTGGSGPAPDPVNISWTESSEGEREEEEDIDIVGEKTDRPSLAVLDASRGELVNGKYQTEVLLH